MSAPPDLAKTCVGGTTILIYNESPPSPPQGGQMGKKWYLEKNK